MITVSGIKSGLEYHRQRECNYLLYLFRHLLDSHRNLFFPLAMINYQSFPFPLPVHSKS
jgi:hypothetical protein